MKKLIFTVLFLPLLALSCDSKEDFELDLTGSWVTLSLNDRVESNNPEQSQAILDAIQERYFADTYTFNSDGTVDFKSIDKGSKKGKYYYSERKLHIEFKGESPYVYATGLMYGTRLISSREIRGGLGDLAPYMPKSITGDATLQVNLIKINHYLFKIGSSIESIHSKPNIPGIPNWDRVPDVVEYYKEKLN